MFNLAIYLSIKFFFRNIDFKADDCILPPVETIIDRANKMNVTKEDLILLKKEYLSNVAINPRKEIKRLPTLFETPSDNVSVSIRNTKTHHSPEENPFAPAEVSFPSYFLTKRILITF
jgi:hypothetical protein